MTLTTALINAWYDGYEAALYNTAIRIEKDGVIVMTSEGGGTLEAALAENKRLRLLSLKEDSNNNKEARAPDAFSS